jgi:hypothetical protein
LSCKSVLFRLSSRVCLVNANNPNAAVAKNVREMAPSLALQLHVLNAGTEQEIDAAFASPDKLLALADEVIE